MEENMNGRLECWLTTVTADINYHAVRS